MEGGDINFNNTKQGAKLQERRGKKEGN